MDYSRIIHESFRIAWEHKSLWIFGVFVSGGAAFNFDPTPFGWEGGEDLPWGLSPGMLENWQPSWEVILPLVALVGSIVLLSIILSFIAYPALIDGANKIKRGGVYTFSSSFSAGLDFFFRFVGLTIVFAVVTVVATLITVLLAIGAFKVSPILGGLYLVVAIPVAIAGMFSTTTVYYLAERVIVLRNATIGDGISEGILLLRQNVVPCILIALISIGLALGIAIVTFVASLLFSIPFAAIGALSGLGLIPAILMSVLIGLPLSIVVGGYVGASMTNLYTLFYIELVEPSKPLSSPAPLQPAG